jgi:hypothetical protein
MAGAAAGWRRVAQVSKAASRPVPDGGKDGKNIPARASAHEFARAARGRFSQMLSRAPS